MAGSDDTSRAFPITEREAAVLRLLATGHDTKSAADQLGISVHAANERLRDARRKLGVTSSREAARRFSAGERGVQIVWDKTSGGEKGGGSQPDRPAGPDRRTRLWLGGLLMLTTLTALPLLYLAAAGSAAATPPRVVSVSPANGAVIPAGSFTLSVTFDRAMAPRSWSFVQVSRATYPECKGDPVQSADLRTFTLACTAKAGRSYELWFNRGPFQNFRAADGQAATPYRFRFRSR